jgi:glycosyltransferase involved in cell wall biosynthesis
MDSDGIRFDNAVRDPPQGEIVLVHVANFYPEKDYDTVVRAVAALGARGVTCRLHICGGFLSNGDEDTFRSLVRQLQVEDRIVFHGATSREEVLEILRRAHVGLLSSRTEGQPNAIMEYMHSGLPVVATRIAGVQELLGIESERFLFDVGDWKRLADLIEELGADAKLRLDAGQHNRERLMTHFSPERILPKWSQLLEDLS